MSVVVCMIAGKEKEEKNKMGIIDAILNLFAPEKKKTFKKRPKVSQWYRYPFIPNWAYNSGPPQNTIEDKITDLRLKKGTYYKIITRGRAYKIITKRKKQIRRNSKRRR